MTCVQTPGGVSPRVLGSAIVPKTSGRLQVKGSQTMNVISAIFALLGIVAFIVDLNLNGLYRSGLDYYSYLVLVSGGTAPPVPGTLPWPLLHAHQGLFSLPLSPPRGQGDFVGLSPITPGDQGPHGW